MRACADYMSVCLITNVITLLGVIIIPIRSSGVHLNHNLETK